MSHELTIHENGFVEMAYAGKTPWTGLGQQLTRNATIDEWLTAAGMRWKVMRTPVTYEIEGKTFSWPEQEVLYRSDTKARLSIVSDIYKIVQPSEILEFFRNLVEANGFQIETAGTLKGGKRIWALARTGFEGNVVDGDEVRTYLLLVTSCDHGLATTALYTSVRVVCNNTLNMALNGSTEGRIKIRHNTTFDPTAVQEGLGLGAMTTYLDFMTRMRALANKSLSGHMAREVVEKMFELKGTTGGIKGIQESKGFIQVMSLFNGDGKGSQLDGVQGTAWGLLNAVTEYTDFHVRAKDQDNRLNSAWFGAGAATKESMLLLLDEV